MADIRLNKTELKNQKNTLAQLTRYLPTLQLKKQQLQLEVENVKAALRRAEEEMHALKNDIEKWAILLSENMVVNIYDLIRVKNVEVAQENVAGIDVPFFKNVEFYPVEYSRLRTPVWIDEAKRQLRDLVKLRENVRVTGERLELLTEELRQTNIKVNLFEKRMIPQARENIRRIKIFLGDQEIAAICNAKIAKDKLKRKEELKRQESRQ